MENTYDNGMRVTASKLPKEPASKLAKLKKRSGFVGDPDDIIGMDWSRESRGARLGVPRRSSLRRHT
jgi:hypothetical protein